MHSYLSEIGFEISILNIVYLSSEHSVFTSARMGGYVVVFLSQRWSTSGKLCGNNPIEEYILHVFEEFDKTVCQ
jgi:hypothetical protein